MANFSSPYQALAALAELSRQRATGLPQQETFEETWTGVGFMLSGEPLVAPMQQVTEILTPPHYTRLPGVKSWVLGVANVRGRLVPLIDLCVFMALPSRSAGRSRRVLIVEQNDILVGLLVDQVLGMQHFRTTDGQDASTRIPDAMRPFIEGAFQKNNELWHLFSMDRLIGQEQFMQVAA
ncbi:MAG: chemotaxis protein CheW [Natronospirillum sp.]|uniref:chemotaxis protein CheW n=1 Tax=Natronospirillum sp. TaxID=2812955 RepID=UPI0025D9C3FC|nr:chemotaxis protein CheW [Natronospirillum sp.]MCH8551703.1 chemotaxis protein CheW [Natronospirillum sp.]